MAQLKKEIKKNALPEKEFITRNSVLIDLFENHHIRTVYHMFLALFVGLFVNTAVDSYIAKRQILPGFGLIIKGFGKFHIAIFGWLCFFLVTCLCFYLFKIWAHYRNNSSKKLQPWDLLWLIATIIYYVSCFIASSRFISFFELPPASSAIISLEQTRLLMKLHSFLRVNVARIIKYKPHSDQDDLLLKKPVEFSKFLYFLFIPTLIYRDEYPRTDKIRVNFVFFRFLEVLGVIFALSFIFDRYLNQTISEFGKRKFTINEIILIILESSLTGVLVLLLSFFLLLHSWLNLFAELTRFGDRMFYKDWWTSTSFAEWFRKWNVVVHDWLYTYIYKDMYEVVTNNNRLVARLTVFLISDVVHEWIVCYMFGFLFPLLFIEFFFGFLLNLVNPPKKPILNVLLLYFLALGMASLVSLYTIEYNARTNQPIVNPTFRNSFIPRFLTCNCIES